MNTRLLIDAIVRQTTVLIAQLSTTAGIRAPLAHIADQVFLDLVKEIENQGVGKKVVADMFGLALRTYQKKVRRLTESVTVRDRTLWEAVLDYLQQHGSTARGDLLKRFFYDGEENVAAVLNDLVLSGVVYKTGSGPSTIYGMTSRDDYKQLLDRDAADSVAQLVWVAIYRSAPTSRKELVKSLSLEEEVLDGAIAVLLEEGRIEAEQTTEGLRLRAGRFLVPVGSAKGWEAAVFDHYQAIVTAVCAKLQGGVTQSARDDVVGGATLSFDVYPGHPHEDRVYGLLKEVRGLVNELWDEVSAPNQENPVSDEEKVKVTFYFGQGVQNFGNEQDT